MLSLASVRTLPSYFFSGSRARRQGGVMEMESCLELEELKLKEGVDTLGIALCVVLEYSLNLCMHVTVD